MTKKKQVNENDCFSSPPPWIIAKTKEEAWKIGYNSGHKECKERLDARIKELESRGVNMNQERFEKETKLMNSVGQTIEALAKIVSAKIY